MADQLGEHPGKAGEVGGDAEHDEQARVGPRSGADDGESGEEDRQGAAGSGLRRLQHAGVQHRRQEKCDGADHGQSHPAEQVQPEVPDVKPLVVLTPGRAGGVRHEDSEGDAGHETSGSSNVVAHQRRKSGRKGAAQLSHEEDGVEGGVGTDENATGEHDMPRRGGDSDHHHGRADGVHRETHSEPGAAARRRVLEQAVGEVLAPDEDRRR